MKRFKDAIKRSLVLFDVLAVPVSGLCCLFLAIVRRLGVERLPLQRWVFAKIGVFPIRDHYYEPLFNPLRLKRSLRQDRHLPGINFNDREQLKLLDAFDFNEELLSIPLHSDGSLSFYYQNDSFLSGDAEFLFNIIRHYRPRKLIEIGCGNSTLMMIEAIVKNRQKDPSYSCEHIAIEPFNAPWLESLGIKPIRKLVEDVDPELFQSLDRNDILFIDSSHMIRPQGDVLREYLELLPSLRNGVLIHVHDIFSPKDYLDLWVLKQVRFWNEQYLLEAFLTLNDQFEVIGALNYLHHHYRAQLCSKCPILASEPEGREPGSFWMRRR